MTPGPRRVGSDVDVGAAEESARWETELRAASGALLRSARHRPMPFRALVGALQGADPMDVVRVLEEHAEDPTLRSEALRMFAEAHDNRFRGASMDVDHLDAQLPTPHPLDFDWRFTVQTRRDLRDRVERRVHLQRPRILLLGCPSLALEWSSTRTGGPISLFDDNAALEQTMSAHARDVAFHRIDLVLDPSVTSGVLADVTIADPPFYPDEQRAFLRAAAAGTVEAGVVLLALPGNLTRPGVRREQDSLMAEAQLLGLDLQTITSDALRYQRPPFEAKVHARAGLEGVPADWRTADLACFIRGPQQGVVHAVAPLHPTGREDWEEVVVHGTRWRVLCGYDSGRARPARPALGALLEPLSDSGAVMSVSRRSPLRSTATVWTDGNQAFRTSSPSLLCALLRALATGSPPLSAARANLGRGLEASERAVLEAAIAVMRQQ